MNFEEYIREIRPTLDVEQPDEEHIWIGISNSLKMQKRTRYWKYALMAAAMIVVALTVGYQYMKNSEQPLFFVNLDPEIAKQEVELVNLIKSYTRQVEHENFNLETLPTTPDELKYTDKLIEAYSADLKQYGANQELTETLLDLYEKKIMLLKRMLNEIEKEKEYENTKFLL